MSWEEVKGVRQASHTVELMTMAHYMSNEFTNAMLLLNRYFLTLPAVDRLDALNAGGGGLRAIIMAKSNAIAYERLGARKPGARGRSRRKGETG